MEFTPPVDLFLYSAAGRVDSVNCGVDWVTHPVLSAARVFFAASAACPIAR